MLVPRHEVTLRAAETATKTCLPQQPCNVMLPQAWFYTAEDYELLPVCRSGRQRRFIMRTITRVQYRDGR